MKTMTKKHRWSCTTASLAMILEEPEENIFDEIGHDGSRMIDPQMPEPLGRVGFHPQEIIDYCLAAGYSATPYQVLPCSLVAGIEVPIENEYRIDRFVRHLQFAEGVVFCRTVNDRHHAMAFSKGEVVDPDTARVIDLRGCEDNDQVFKMFADYGFYPLEILIVEKMV